MSEFRRGLGPDGVEVIRWDVAERAMNAMSLRGLAELEAGIDRVFDDLAIKGAVITCGKESIAGTMALHALLRKIERAGMHPEPKQGGKPSLRRSPAPRSASATSCRAPVTG